MQWLIDLIIESIGVPPCFINRGDPAANDFRWEGHTFDPTTFDLDLSGIVPEGATAVSLRITGINLNVGADIRLRTKGNANWINMGRLLTQVSTVTIEKDVVVPLSASRILEMFVSPAAWSGVDISVKGWWL